MGDMWQYPGGFALLLAGLGYIGVGIPGLFIANLIADVGVMALVRGTSGAWLWA